MIMLYTIAVNTSLISNSGIYAYAHMHTVFFFLVQIILFLLYHVLLSCCSFLKMKHHARVQLVNSSLNEKQGFIKSVVWMKNTRNCQRKIVSIFLRIDGVYKSLTLFGVTTNKRLVFTFAQDEDHWIII